MSEKIPTQIVFEIAETIKKLSTELAEARRLLDEARTTLVGIATVTPKYWELPRDQFIDGFLPWAQSRARDTAAKIAAPVPAQPTVPLSLCTNYPAGTSHIRKTNQRSFSSGEFALYFECFKREGSDWFYYYTDSDNEYPCWRNINDGRYRTPRKIIEELAPVPAQPAYIPEQPHADFEWVSEICNAYESGVGHNGRPTADVNPYLPGTPQHTAYEIGANEMKHNAQASAQGDKP